METSPTDEPTKTDVKEVSTVDVGEAATRPTKVKDFTVLANLVQLFEHSIPKCDFKWYVVKTQTQYEIARVNLPYIKVDINTVTSVSVDKQLKFWLLTYLLMCYIPFQTFTFLRKLYNTNV